MKISSCWKTPTAIASASCRLEVDRVDLRREVRGGADVCCAPAPDPDAQGYEVPYVTHLLAVAAIVGENGGTEDEVIAALLHDAVEDQGGAATREEIRKRFGNSVAIIVDGTTDTDVIPKPPWQERKRNYVAHVSGASRSVRLVSAADKLHNARSILRDLRTEGEVTWQRFSAGREDQLWYYRALVDAFRTAGGTDEIVDELEEVVEEIAETAV